MAIHYGGFNSSSHTDSFGFIKPDDFDDEKYESFITTYLPILARRDQRWEKLVMREPGLPNGQVILPETIRTQRSLPCCNCCGDCDGNSELKRFIRKGVPASLRPQIWMEVSGAQQNMMRFPGEYRRMAAMKPNARVLDAISKDVVRTFPDNEYFRDIPGSLRDELATLLTAFANKNPHVGYCQGLNFIAGMLLLVLRNPEHAFWLMHTVIVDLPDYYSPDMLGLRIDMKILWDIVRQKAPRLYAQCDYVGFDPSMFMTKWFVCWYLETLPIETVLRIWDCFFNEGRKVFFRVALALILHNRQILESSQNFPQMTDAFKNVTKGEFALNCHELIQEAHHRSTNVSMAKIDRQHNDHQLDLDRPGRATKV